MSTGERPRDVLDSLAQRLFLKLAAKGQHPATAGADYVIAADGQFLGNLDSNRFDINSLANPYGPYGSRYSPLSILNPHWIYGSRYSVFSPFNPYSATPPSVFIAGAFAGYLTVNSYLTPAMAPDVLIREKVGLDISEHRELSVRGVHRPPQRLPLAASRIERMVGDTVLAFGRAIAAGIPGIGGPLQSLISDYVAKSEREAVETWLRSLGRRVKWLERENRIDIPAVDREEFAELFAACGAAVQRTRQKERHVAAGEVLANLLLKPGDSDKLEYEELHHFARCLETLSRGAITVLAVALRVAKTQSTKNLERDSVPLRFGDISSGVPRLRPTLVMGLVAELDRMNLLHRPGAPGFRDPDYSNYSIELTPLGSRFSRYILEYKGEPEAPERVEPATSD